MLNYNPADQNLPTPRRSSDDLVELVGRSTRHPASMRQAIPYINVPGPGQTWQELNQWRAAYGLRPVTC
jgi:hypothetical protein